MKLAWLTDIHLDHVHAVKREVFYEKIKETGADYILISGDIANSTTFQDLLMEMQSKTGLKILFVLGNHDYYGSSIRGTRSKLVEEMYVPFCQDKINWLPDSEYHFLTHDLCILGQDGWYDARYGNHEKSRIGMVMNDWIKIEELRNSYLTLDYDREALVNKCREIADAEAEGLKDSFEAALKQSYPKKMIILTHVPPFKEACFYRGQPTEEGILPFYSSKVMGDTISKIASEHPDIDFTVLCGHTHGKVEYRHSGNLLVKAGGATYGHSEIQEVIEA